MDLHGATWTAPASYEMRSDVRRFELWERNHAALLGLGAAARYALDCGLRALELRIATVAQVLRERLALIDGVQVHDRGSTRCGIVTFTVSGVDATTIKHAMRRRDIHVSVSRRSSTLIDMDDRNLREVVRASVHALTTHEEVDTFAAAVRGLI